MGLYQYRFTTIDPHRMLSSVGGKVGCIKRIREVFGIGLKEAKDIADGLGHILFECTTLASHESLDAIMRDFGVSVILNSSVEFGQPQIAFVVMRNSDMTEGRGPMMMDSIFIDRAEAVIYMDSQPGVMGRTVQWSKENYGDWRIEERPI